MKVDVKKEVEKGIATEKQKMLKSQMEFQKTRNKMKQLENSLKISAQKYDRASEEIKKLKEQIEKGITPQIEGLLEEGKLLLKLQELFPDDKFEHVGKGGDILQFVMEKNNQVGIIVYECKKVKTFSADYVRQAKDARQLRNADFAILVTNAFPAKKQYYFVEKSVFVISPLNLEPITHTLRDNLIKIALLKMSNEAKEKAVQMVYDYLSGKEYNEKMNNAASELIDLGKELKSEIGFTQERIWKKRYKSYTTLYNDVGLIDYKLKEICTFWK